MALGVSAVARDLSCRRPGHELNGRSVLGSRGGEGIPLHPSHQRATVQGSKRGLGTADHAPTNPGSANEFVCSRTSQPQPEPGHLAICNAARLPLPLPLPLPHPHPSGLICCTAPHRTPVLAPTKMGSWPSSFITTNLLWPGGR